MADLICNYTKNYRSVYIAGYKVGECQEFDYTREIEDQKDVHFDGVKHNNHKYPDITITVNRLISYNDEQEALLEKYLDCMLTDPQTITYIEQKSVPDEEGSIKVTRKSISFKNCRLSKDEQNFKADENSKMNLEFTSEGIIRDSSNPHWSTVE